MTASEKWRIRSAAAAARAIASRVRKETAERTVRVGDQDVPMARMVGVDGHLARLLAEICMALEEVAGAIDAMVIIPPAPRKRPAPLTGVRSRAAAHARVR